jgi:hypothetical protein
MANENTTALINNDIRNTGIALDYDSPAPAHSVISNEQLIFFFFYAFVMPLVLFILSRVLRCLRHRGIISMSNNSEECILNECQRHISQGITTVGSSSSSGKPLQLNSRGVLKTCNPSSKDVTVVV